MLKVPMLFLKGSIGYFGFQPKFFCFSLFALALLALATLTGLAVPGERKSVTSLFLKPVTLPKRNRTVICVDIFF
jgi:hypothetical protein